MGMFDLFLKSVFQSNAGKINWYSNMWAIVGSKWDKKRCVNKNLIGGRHVNENGEWLPENGVVLVRRRCTINCPNPPSDDFFVNDDNRAQVPATEYRKCPYHIKAQKGVFNFPRCTFNKSKELGDVAKATLNSFNGMVDEAVKKTKEILK